MVLYAALIVFFAFFYTAIVFNPKETADNLKKHGGFIPGIRPGERTAEYIDYVLTRITVLGAAYLVIICLIPGTPGLLRGVAVLFRRHLASDRGVASRWTRWRRSTAICWRTSMRAWSRSRS